jgi:hypothetical protein
LHRRICRGFAGNAGDKCLRCRQICWLFCGFSVALTGASLAFAATTSVAVAAAASAPVLAPHFCRNARPGSVAHGIDDTQASAALAVTTQCHMIYKIWHHPGCPYHSSHRYSSIFLFVGLFCRFTQQSITTISSKEVIAKIIQGVCNKTIKTMAKNQEYDR